MGSWNPTFRKVRETWGTLFSCSGTERRAKPTPQLTPVASLRHSSRRAARCETESGLSFVLRIGRYSRINDNSVVFSAGSAPAQFTDRCPLIHLIIPVVSAAPNL